MRRTYIEDAIVVAGGGVLIAVAWLMHWQAGIIVAALVCMLIAVVAYRHSHHGPQSPPSMPREPHRHEPEWSGAASWRHHTHLMSPRESGRRELN